MKIVKPVSTLLHMKSLIVFLMHIVLFFQLVNWRISIILEAVEEKSTRCSWPVMYDFIWKVFLQLVNMTYYYRDIWSSGKGWYQEIISLNWTYNINVTTMNWIWMTTTRGWNDNLNIKEICSLYRKQIWKKHQLRE